MMIPISASGQRRATLLLLAAALTALTAPVAAKQNSTVKMTTTLTSSGAHKECVELNVKQGLRYSFRADATVDFNIQYQDAEQLVYAVKRDKLSSLSGQFMPKQQNTYCMVWTNLHDRPVKLSFEYARLRR